MTIGVAASLSLFAALLRFASDILQNLADWARALGDPELPTVVLVFVVYLAGSGRYTRACAVLVGFALVDLVDKESGFGGSGSWIA